MIAHLGHVADVFPAQAVVIANVVGADVPPINAAHNAQHSVVEADVSQVYGQISGGGCPFGGVDQRRIAFPFPAAIAAAQAKGGVVFQLAEVKIIHRIGRVSAAPYGPFDVFSVTEVDDRVRIAEVDLIALPCIAGPQPVESLVDRAVVVPNPLALLFGPCLSPIVRAADHGAAFSAPFRMPAPQGARTATVTIEAGRQFRRVVHGDGQIRDGDLAVAEVPDAAPVGREYVETLVAVHNDVSKIAQLTLSHTVSSARFHCDSPSANRNGSNTLT